ncbi:hypothetical protein COL48_12290 [Bacillus toyonensis]|uniref:hypothetical protein n=1 Tax=Bacillus TaxID=1386 RepID=UPI000B51AD5D|nr:MULTISPECIES: hypothetical protein [Bacillus]MBD8074071.1 hypothetical protein [Bacillus thuringiensis]MDA1782684.1 hypothetical protein [Bacillus cereus]MDZ4537940.1 hypothetical protein [Bacillus cereus]OWT50527.1 hypothetical protein CER22_15425 [Bacillus sp. K2I17]PFY32514.1 hypothetical protein COL48_12290 [Bacillus toyonensis]
MKNQDYLEKIMIEEVKIIQDIIKRMSSNSFIIKGWTITLVVGSLLFKGEKIQFFISFIPLIMFWFLDAYFLRQERLYRKLYEWVIKERVETDLFLLSMDTDRFRMEVPTRIQIMFSSTLIYFYALIGLLIAVYLVYIN